MDDETIEQSMTPAEFEALREIVFQTVGVRMTPAKIPLLAARLRGPMRRRGLKTFAEYAKHMQGRRSQDTMAELASAVTTNHTHFWREPLHFELLEREILPELIAHARKNGSRMLRAWCSACATGQEAYTMAALIMNALGAEYAGWDAGLLATDISERALRAALEGRYHRDDVASLPLGMQRRMLENDGGEFYRVRPEIAAEVTYRRLNLVGAPYQFKRPFDLVFCRNVMIYFDDMTRSAVISRLAAVVRPGGYLVVGLAESLGSPRCFEAVAPSVYRRREVCP